MSIDFQTVKQQVAEFGKDAPERLRRQQDLLAAAGRLLAENADRQDWVREKIDAAAAFNPNLVTGVPTHEALNAACPVPAAPEHASLLAADGSQIYPDRHGQVFYGLVNIGTISMRHGAGGAPEESVRSRLLYESDTFTEYGRITDRLVTLMRDLGERELLAEIAPRLERPVFTFTDGPLELWDAREAGMSRQAFEESFDRYIDALRALHRSGASTAGYLDKPGTDQLVRMLEIVQLPLEDLKQAGKIRPFLGLTDIDLLRSILKTHERSAIYQSCSASSSKYADALAIHFFYLNVGPSETGEPYLVRVEIPAWVAEDPQRVSDLHALLIAQCRILGARPYPYVLHRSHEVALVTEEETEQVENMIIYEFRRQGIPVPPRSFKSALKRARGSRSGR